MKYLILIIAMLLEIEGKSQQISVQSFRKLENDLSARGSDGRKDQNGDPCAIIKVVTTETGFDFDPDALGSMGSVQKKGEIWLYVPYGAKRLTVRHAKLGMMRNYAYPERIDKACVYEMVLATGRVETVVHEQITKQYWVLSTEPKEAMVYVDDEFAGSGMQNICKQLPLGKHTYRVESPMYHPAAGSVELTAERKLEQRIVLTPAFGYVGIRTLPEEGAQVFIDDELLDDLTPCRSGRLKSGIHRIKVLKTMYIPETKEITIKDEQIHSLEIRLRPNYGEVSVNCDPEGCILINGEKKGIERWKGKLDAGLYTVEVTKPAYRSQKKDIEVKTGEQLQVRFEAMEPIYGILDISSEPVGASIRIDGRPYGTTPNLLREILVGEHRVKLTKNGYKDAEKYITVDELKIVRLNVSLEEGTEEINLQEGKNTSGQVLIGKPRLRTGLKVGEKYMGYVVFSVSDNGFHGKVVSPSQGNYAQTAHSRYAQGYNHGGLEWRLPSALEMNQIYGCRGRLGIVFENQWYWTAGAGTVFGMGRGVVRGKVPAHITYPAVYVAEF